MVEVKSYTNIEFESLLQDESFIIKIVKGGPETDQYIKELIQKYPDKKEEILFAVQFIKTVGADRKRLSGADAAEIWETIRKKHKQQKFSLPGTNRHLFSIGWRVAAVAVILLGFGYYFYLQYTMDLYKQMAENTAIAEDEAKIVFSDGSEYRLDNNESSIRYDAEGEKIIVTETGNLSEKIENRKETKEEILNQVIVPYGRRHSVTLSDGTTIQLNSGSKLIFPARFKGGIRKVYLKGEGYFEVAKNKKAPFIVNTDYLDINVTGTIFNVSAYEDEQTVSAVLVEGSVEVSQKNKLFGNPKFTLTPGQGCFYSVKTSQSAVSEVDLMNYIGWKDGWLQFKDQPLVNIVRRVEKYYNKDILIEGEKLANTLISGKLVLSDQLEDAIVYLAKTLEGHYERNDKEIYILKE